MYKAVTSSKTDRMQYVFISNKFQGKLKKKVGKTRNKRKMVERKA